MSHQATDPYFYMLDHPEARSFDGFGRALSYVTPMFEREIYQEARQMHFNNFEEAHLDWLLIGKRLGLEFGSGRNTLLKAVLKVKDDPQFTEHWVRYHSAILGAHNIIVADCGSTTTEHLDLLSSIGREVLVVKYDRFFNLLHGSKENAVFYQTLSANCKYLVVLDSDEYLVGIDNKGISPHLIPQILAPSHTAVFAGSWIPNIDPLISNFDDKIDWSAPVKLGLNEGIIEWGTTSGKAILASSAVRTLVHIGHIMHTSDMLPLLDKSSFAKIAVIHLVNPTDKIRRQRARTHLQTKGILPKGLTRDMEIEEFIKKHVDDEQFNDYQRVYMKRFLGERLDFGELRVSISSQMLESLGYEECPSFVEALSSYDYVGLIDRTFRLLNHRS